MGREFPGTTPVSKSPMSARQTARGMGSLEISGRSGKEYCQQTFAGKGKSASPDVKSMGSCSMATEAGKEYRQKTY